MIVYDVVETRNPEAARIINKTPGRWLVDFFYKRDEAEDYVRRATQSCAVQGIHYTLEERDEENLGRAQFEDLEEIYYPVMGNSRQPPI